MDSAIGSPCSWPRRRNPIPAFPVGTSPRGRRPVTPRSFTDSSDLWDADTVMSRTPSPTTPSARGSLHHKQHQRAADELTKQIEKYEHDIHTYLVQIDELQQKLDESGRRERAGREECEQYWMQLVVCEDEQQQQQKELDQLKRLHKSELQSIERRHSRTVDDLSAKLLASKSDASGLGVRLIEVSKVLSVRCRELDQAAVANASLLERLREAQQAKLAAQESLAQKSKLVEDYREEIAVLEQLLSSQMPPGTVASDLVGQSDHARQLPAINELSLFVEIAQATDSLSAPLPYPDTQIGGQTSPTTSDSTEASDATAVAHQPKGALYWAAVYVHMLWAVYVRLCVQPVLRLAVVVSRAALGLVVPEMLLHINVALLVSRLKAVVS